MRATARPPRRPKGMNKTEAAYAQVLELRKQAGEIRDYRFEPITFKLAPSQGDNKGTTYAPDFEVVNAEGHFEYHEVKSWWNRPERHASWKDDALVKIKVAAAQFPERVFIGAEGRCRKGLWEWRHESFSDGVRC